jgi:hypothetical protein
LNSFQGLKVSTKKGGGSERGLAHLCEQQTHQRSQAYVMNFLLELLHLQIMKKKGARPKELDNVIEKCQNKKQQEKKPCR